MSKLDELIKQLCPGGVQYKEFKEISRVLKKGTLKTDVLVKDGKYPVMNSGRSIYGRYNSYNNEGEAITVAARGEYACFINYFDEKFWAGGLCYPYKSIDETKVKTKFIYYYLKLKQEYIRSKLVTEGGIPALNKTEIDKFNIPIPPLAIQEEIVNILDAFTTLKAELELELNIRKQQFSYYRDQLFSFEGKEVQWKTLGDIGEFVRGNGLQKTDFTEKGVGCIHYGQIYTYYGTCTEETKSFVSHALAKKLKKARKGDLIITNTSENIEDVCKAVVWLGDEEIVTGGHATIFKHKENPKFIAYYTQTNKFYIEMKKYAQGAKVTDVSAKNLAKILIPVPPLNVQDKIVNFLEKLDFLINDKSCGLPAEIKARNKQYEYYRYRLLTFKNFSDE